MLETFSSDITCLQSGALRLSLPLDFTFAHMASGPEDPLGSSLEPKAGPRPGSPHSPTTPCLPSPESFWVDGPGSLPGSKELESIGPQTSTRLPARHPSLRQDRNRRNPMVHIPHALPSKSWHAPACTHRPGRMSKPIRPRKSCKAKSYRPIGRTERIAMASDLSSRLLLLGRLFLRPLGLTSRIHPYTSISGHPTGRARYCLTPKNHSFPLLKACRHGPLALGMKAN